MSGMIRYTSLLANLNNVSYKDNGTDRSRHAFNVEFYENGIKRHGLIIDQVLITWDAHLTEFVDNSVGGGINEYPIEVMMTTLDGKPLDRDVSVQITVDTGLTEGVDYNIDGFMMVFLEGTLSGDIQTGSLILLKTGSPGIFTLELVAVGASVEGITTVQWTTVV